MAINRWLMDDPQKRRDDPALLAFWQVHTGERWRGLLIGDGWTFDSQTQSYTAASGSAPTQADIRALALSFMASVSDSLSEAAKPVAGQSVIDRQKIVEMTAKIRRDTEDEFILLAALAAGGLSNLTDDDWRDIEGSAVAGQDVGVGLADVRWRLDRFAGQIERGEAGDMADITDRAGMYSQGGYQVMEAVRRNSHARATGDDGQPLFTHERNLLDPFADHCEDSDLAPGCVEETERGWVRIGELSSPGERTCGLSCHCALEFGNEDNGTDLLGSPR